MYLHKHEIKIIKLLISSNNFISSYDISTATGIKRSLVRNEMMNVKSALKSLGIELISKTAKGYMLEALSFHDLSVLEQTINQAERQRESLFPTVQGERQIFIFKRLLESDGYIKIDTLVEELLISRSTITNDLKDSRRRLQKYGLILKQRPNYGLHLVGEELSKRRLLCDFLFTNLRISNMFYDYLNLFLIHPTTIEYSIIECLKAFEIRISDLGLIDFLLNVTVSFTRIQNGYHLTKGLDVIDLEKRDELTIARRIGELFQREYQCTFHEFEIQQIAIQLLCKQENPKPIADGFDSSAIIEEITAAIYAETLIDLQEPTMAAAFSSYIQATILRLICHERIRNPLFNELKGMYPLGYELACITSEVFKKHFHEPLSLSELAFYTLFFNNYIQHHRTIKKKVLVVSGYGKESAELCEYLLNQRFANQISIEKSIPYYLLHDEYMQSYDFIVSTIPIHDELPIPYVNISQSVAIEDLDKISNHLSYLYHNSGIETLFHPRLYKRTKAKNRTEVIQELEMMLMQQFSGLKGSLDTAFSSKERYELISFPHEVCFIKLLKPLNNHDIVTVLILEEAIIWDKNKIRLIILFSSLDVDNYILNTLTAIITKLSKDTEAIQKIMQGSTYAEFLRIAIVHQ